MSAHSGESGRALEGVVAPLLGSLQAGLPVLGMTVAELERLRALQERAPSAGLSAAILRDPLMSLRVLHFLSDHRTRSQSADITTISHAILMLGQARFFREFAALASVEDSMADERLADMRALASRARLAALLARDFAVQRHDVEPEEIMLAALLREAPVMLMALLDRAAAVDAGTLACLRPQLLAALGVPELLARLNACEQAHDPRSAAVGIACRLACACSARWCGEEVAAELELLQRLLRTSRSQAWERVRRTLLQAAREWRYYATPPALRHLPLIVE